MKTVRIQTLGCRLNQIESESIAHIFLNNNFDVNMDNITAVSPDDDSTFLVIINTCTVTQKAEQKARRIIRVILKKYKNAAVIVTGCYAQLSQNEIEKIDERIAVICGQVKSRIEQIPLLLDKYSNKNNWIENINKFLVDVKQINQKTAEKPGFPEDSFKLSTSSFLAHSRASLKIQDGCNNACSYCAIHFARGHSVSIDVKTAVERVKQIEEKGNAEVVLTTINIAQYRGLFIDENGKETYVNFARLLKILLQNTKSISFRISSLYPEIVDDEFCDVIKDKRVRPHFHISVQSGSNKILKSMNRVYNAQDVLNACNKLRQCKPDAFLACDIITGFPGETEEDFNETLSLCKKCNFSWIHAFPFSERPGTPACKIKPKIPQNVSGKRAKILTDWAIQQKINYIKYFTGKELSAILETKKICQEKINDTENYIYHCMTENFIHCQITTNKKLDLDKEYQIKIISPLTEKIKKGGEIEAQAKINN